MQFRQATCRDLKRLYEFVAPRTRSTIGNWSRRDAMKYFLYYIKCKLCGVSESEGQVMGVVLGRPVLHVEQGVHDRFALDWSGKILWVEAVITLAGIGFEWLGGIDFLTRYGCRFTHVAWNRERRRKPVVFPISRVHEILGGSNDDRSASVYAA